MDLTDFVTESNRIEGINRDPLPEEITAHKKLLAYPVITVAALADFVATIQPGARLRRSVGMDVRVGSHTAPPGGTRIEARLMDLLNTAIRAGKRPAGAYSVHLAYEDLHPFMDGNGRSGRVLWLWMMGGKAPIGFLRQFYYDTLENSRP